MVRIRLARSGAKGRPFYHITVADQRFARDGRFIERIGYFNPLARGKQLPLVLRRERFDYWCKMGAQPSKRVLHLAKQVEDRVSSVIS